MPEPVKDDKREWQRLRRAVDALNGAFVTVGVHGEDGKRKDGEFTNVQLAGVHEFGSPAQKIPARSFIRAGIDEGVGQITAAGEALAQQALDGKLRAEQAASQIGLFAVGYIQARMSQGLKPNLAHATILARLKKSRAGRAAIKALAHANKKKENANTAKRLGKFVAVATQIKPLIDTGQLRQSIAHKTGKDGGGNA